MICGTLFGNVYEVNIQAGAEFQWSESYKISHCICWFSLEILKDLTDNVIRDVKLVWNSVWYIVTYKFMT